jgi:hypothetical protein
MRFKFTINNNTKVSFRKLGGYMDSLIASNSVPGILKIILKKIKDVGAYFVDTNEPNNGNVGNRGGLAGAFSNMAQSCAVF